MRIRNFVSKSKAKDIFQPQNVNGGIILRCKLIMTMNIILDVVHRHEFLHNRMLWKMDLLPSSGMRGKAGPVRRRNGLGTRNLYLDI
jgi:hypothetical protein